MVERTIANATISSTKLGFDRGVFLCAWLHLNYGGSGQGFGGFVLDNSSKPIGENYAGRYLTQLLETVGVEKWEDLEGKHVRAEFDNSRVYRIGHIIKDKWFDPEELNKAAKT